MRRCERLSAGMAAARASLLLCACLACSEPAFAGLALIDLGHLDGAPPGTTGVGGISANGKVVVGSSGSRAFRWENGVMTEIAGGKSASSTNADGSVVVGALTASTHAFRWTALGGMLDLGALPNAPGETVAQAISADGSTVVGWAGSDELKHAWIWNVSEGMRDLGSLGDGTYSTANGVSADGSVVVGGSDRYAFRWTAATGMVAIGRESPETAVAGAAAISADASTIVGYFNAAPMAVHSYPHQFRWTAGGGFQDLPSSLLGDITTGAAFAVNHDGSAIAGRIFYWFAYASLWTRQFGTFDLNAYLIDHGVDLTRWELLDATGISADGDAVIGGGYYYDGQGESEYRAWMITGLNSVDALFRSSFDPAS
jgi:probable HAF family extracellular repeat protein